MPILSLEMIREAIVDRSEKYFPQSTSWSMSQWIVALIGEVGEAANIYKKTFRGDFDFEKVKEDFSRELADIQVYLLLSAHYAGVPPFSYAGPAYKINFPIPELFCRLADKIGQIAYGTYVERGNTLLGVLYREAQLNLEMIAYAANIDLRYATVSKFNEVSARMDIADCQLVYRAKLKP